MAQLSDKVYYGGYNGGGPAQYLSGSQDCYNPVGSGGGATHIAKVSGVLLNLQSEINNILIVSGGGGGANYINAGGSGGGFIGNSGIGDPSYATGGTQDSGGLDRNAWNAMFGGGSGANYAVGSIPDGTFFGGSGGGGGYYGGGRGFMDAIASSGGGSGYIANINLSNKKMYCYNCSEDSNPNTYTTSTYGTTTHNDRDTTNCPNGYSSSPVSKCAKAGNGYARITLVSVD